MKNTSKSKYLANLIKIIEIKKNLSVTLGNYGWLTGACISQFDWPDQFA